MAQNTSYLTIDRIIRQGLKNAGLLAEGDDPTSELYADCMNRLNDLVNAWQTSGLRLWTITDTTLTLVAGQRTYTIGPGLNVNMTRPLSVFEAYYVDINNVRRPLIPLSWDEYSRLSNITTQGAVNSYFVDKQETQLNVSLWLVPDTTAATGSVHLILRNQIPNAAMLTDNIQFPLEWGMALTWGLADEVCTGQPQSIMQRCAQKAAMYKQMLDDWDVEDAPTRFTPDIRSGYAAGKFR